MPIKPLLLSKFQGRYVATSIEGVEGRLMKNKVEDQQVLLIIAEVKLAAGFEEY